MAPTPSTTAPSTHSQPSRKGKRAWRKNVDLTELQSGLESARDETLQTGGKLLADLPATALFETDTTGSAQIRTQARKAHPGLKVDEILARRSALPVVNTRKRSSSNGEARVTDGVILERKRRRGDGVSHAELERLKRVAYGGEAVHQDRVAAEDVPTHDPWAEEIPEPVLPTQSFLTKPKPAVAPPTLKHAPISLTSTGKITPHVPLPSAGRSYNPQFEDWAALLAREGAKAVTAEQKRLAEAEAEANLQQRIAAAAEEAERAETRDAALSEYEESEWEGIQSEVEDSELKRRRPERKTPVERNKATRRKEAERLIKHERRMKERDEQVKRITAIRKELDSKIAQRSSVGAKVMAKASFPGSVQSSDEDDVREDEAAHILRRRRLGKAAVPDAPLEVVLADELQDSLRRLKPEGNLLRDRYRNMLVQGKVEARRAISQPKKAKTKLTEKWSYKDWTLAAH